jgi:serine/threonine protein kinase
VGQSSASNSGSGDQVSTNLTTGSRVRGYRIERVLGHGRLGVLYLAEHERLHRLAVLRVVGPGSGDDTRRMAEALADAAALARLDHPGIAGVYDADTSEDGTLVIATEYVAGGDLRSALLRDGAMEPVRAIRMAAHIARALGAAHDAGIVHGGLSPRSILLDRSTPAKERWCVTDFGVGSAQPDTADSLSGAPAAGDYEYVAPEQLHGQTAAGSDQYALGCVLYHCLVGSPPFTGTSGAVAAAHMHDPPPSPSQARAELDPAIDAVVLRALAKQPGDRHSSATAMAEALETLVPAAAPPATPARPPRRIGRLGAAVALGALALAAIAVAAFSTRSGSASPPPVPPPRPTGSLAYVLVNPPKSSVAVVPARGGVSAVLTSGSAPAWSPDGRSIVVLHRKMTLLHPDGSHPRVLTTQPINSGTGADGPYSKVFAWSPSGRSIAYTFFNSIGQGGVAIMDPQTGDTRTVALDCVKLSMTPADYPPCSKQPLHGACKPVKKTTTPTGLLCQPLYIWAPDWSANGRQIVFTAASTSGGAPQSDLYIVNADGTRLHKVAVTHQQGFPTPEDAVWAPGGRRLAFDACSTDYSACALFTVSIRGGQPRRLRLAPYEAEWDPSFSPDGNFMAFICEMNNINNICEMRLPNGRPHIVVKGAREPQPAGLSWGR